MRRYLSLVALLAVPLSGCIVETVPPPRGCESPSSVGGWLVYRVRAGAGADLPSGDAAYAVTANGQGGYTVAWSDRTGTNANSFSGTLQATAGFDHSQTHPKGLAALTLAPTQISFTSLPGTRVDGVDMVTLSDPLYVDARLNGAGGASIYYTDFVTANLCVVSSPAAFQPQ
jgi:hypothetical protein